MSQTALIEGNDSSHTFISLHLECDYIRGMNIYYCLEHRALNHKSATHARMIIFSRCIKASCRSSEHVYSSLYLSLPSTNTPRALCVGSCNCSYRSFGQFSPRLFHSAPAAMEYCADAKVRVGSILVLCSARHDVFGSRKRLTLLICSYYC